MWRLQNDAAGCGYWASTLSLNEYSHAAEFAEDALTLAPSGVDLKVAALASASGL